MGFCVTSLGFVTGVCHIWVGFVAGRGLSYVDGNCHTWGGLSYLGGVYRKWEGFVKYRRGLSPFGVCKFVAGFVSNMRDLSWILSLKR